MAALAEAWLTMEVVDLTSDIGEILHLASIWVDLHTAISEVEAENLPPNQHPAANARA